MSSPLESRHKRKQTYIIFSVDTEHDIVSRYCTTTDGWTKGIPLLFSLFDNAGMRGKVCWLIEYNLKEGIVANNTSSDFYVEEFPDIIQQIKGRGDESGIHPTMYDWAGIDKRIAVRSYDDPKSWNREISKHDPEFVSSLITSATRDFRAATGSHPIGCRTANFHYATHLATALKNNNIEIDSSVKETQLLRLKSPNIYHADLSDIRLKSATNSGVLEIPTVCGVEYCVSNPFSRTKIEYLLRLKKPVVLSFFIHNWTVLHPNGSIDEQFINKLISFLEMFRRRGACFLSWTEAKQMFDSISEAKPAKEKRILAQESPRPS